MQKKRFRRRVFRSFKQVWKNHTFPFKNMDKVRHAMRGGLVSFAFRERLMMVVSEVNGCRYCIYYHAKESIKVGLSEVEMRSMLQGNVSDAPADEIPALLYAQHWAETDGHPDTDTREKIVARYGKERTDAIETVLHLIRLGNLWGNSWDYFLYRLTFGLHGTTEMDELIVS